MGEDVRKWKLRKINKEENDKENKKETFCHFDVCKVKSSLKCKNQMCRIHCNISNLGYPCSFHSPHLIANNYQPSINMKKNNINNINNLNNNNNNNEKKFDIWFSAREGKFDDVKEWIEIDRVNLNERDDHHNTPLFYACVGGHVNIVRYLINFGAFDDPVEKKCKKNSNSNEIIFLLDKYYDDLLNQSIDKEKMIMQPLVRMLNHLRNHFNPPVKDSIRYQIEQLLPDDWFFSSNNNLNNNNNNNEKNNLNNLKNNNNLGAQNDNNNNNTQNNNNEQSKNSVVDSNVCKICFLELANCVNIPCGHLGFCMECMGPISSCPSCRIPLDGKIRVFHV